MQTFINQIFENISLMHMRQVDAYESGDKSPHSILITLACKTQNIIALSKNELAGMTSFLPIPLYNIDFLV